MMSLLVPAGVALLASMIVVPPTVRVARARGLLDHPDGSRRIHVRPVPRLGGIALWIGALAGLAAWWAASRASGGGISVPAWTPGAFAGLAVMLVVGFVDDVRGIQPRHKLLAQVAAAVLVVAAGFRLDVVSLGGGTALSLGWAAAPLSVLWIVAVTNAFNLIDGLDGLAGGITLVSVLALAASAFFSGNLAMLPVLAAILGGTLGFLRYNHCPATIFLGDVGSLSLGFALSLLSVESARLPDGSVAIVVATFALAFPVLDITIAMLRRWLRGAPLMAADGRHVHHQLVGLGLSHSRAVALICLFAIGVAGLGLSITFAPPVLTLALVTLGAVVWVLLVVHGSRYLQYHEFSEAQASFSSGLLRARVVIRERILARDLEAQIRRAESLGELELVLDQSRGMFGFHRVQLVGPHRPNVLDLMEPPAPRGRLFSLECPLGASANERLDYLLRISWLADSRTPPLYAERVVRMIAPALQDMLASLGAVRLEPQLLGSLVETPGALPMPLPVPVAVAAANELRPRRVAGVASVR
jgi:UDP-GlcNAc:undecaprenyl-phosphate GlcNAc-1-phosphate transferase